MLNPMRLKIKGIYSGGEGATRVTTACPEIAEAKTSYEPSWEVKVMIICTWVYIC